MSYQSLARKYRPHTFSDLIGQEPTAEALGNAIRLKREPSAVLFSGVRGVGKTTTARLYAKALNCGERRDGEPCDRCPSCLSINEGIHEDVLEIDGASHNGVDEVRELQELLAYVNQRSPYKVFIIDEVHMLSINAFNALLKTLEEPPPRVVFILATTNLNKVPQTIIGRCQTFHLQKIALAAIVGRLQTILSSEGIPYEEKALHLIAKEGQGSLRDALTFLDQVIALGQGEVTMARLEHFLTQVSNEVYLKLLAALIHRDGKTCLGLVEGLELRGVSYGQVLEELATLARHGFILRDLAAEIPSASAFGLDQQELNQLLRLAQQAPVLELNRLFRCLLRCKQELDGSALDRFVVENSLLEWCLDPGMPSTADLLRFSQGQGNVQPPPEQRRSLRPQQELPKPPQNEEAGPLSSSTPSRQEPPASKTMPASWAELVALWKKHQPLEARKLEEVVLLTYTAELIEVAVSPSSIIGPQLLRADYQQKISQSLADLFGFQGRFRAKAATSAHNANESLLDEKTRSIKIKQDQAHDAALSHPLTKGLVNTLGGKILRVQVRE